MKLGINEVTNEEYHADRKFLSSSAFKTILKDPEEFIKKYVNGEKSESSNQSALIFGTVAHLMLLEPHLFESSIAVWNGAVKRGKEFEKFKEPNTGVHIISKNEYDLLYTLKEAYLNHPASAWLLENCKFEHTMCAEIDGVMIKARADGINVVGGYIVDVKTTGYAGNKEAFAMTLNDLYYDLSAALYCEVAKIIYGKSFDFYYIVLSKSDKTCHIYKTSKVTAINGLERFYDALTKYKKYLLTNQFECENLETEDVNEILEI